MTTEVERWETLAAEVEQERRRPGPDRATQAQDQSLDGVIRRLDSAVDELRAGNIDRALRHLQHVQYAVAESWSYDADLSIRLLECISAFHRAAR